MRQKVIVVGAGVAGLTAAHELIERDFEVHVVERRQQAGGKAMSRRTDRDLPTEHGFRFFPGWYRHLPDTMRRIPFKGRRNLYEGRSTYDNLITIQSNLLAWYDRDPIEAPMHLPRSLDQLKTLHSFFWDLTKLQLAPAELSFFFARLAAFMAMPEDERREKLTNVTWWDYLEADSKSRAFRDLISATTRTMVAAKATEASAYTICRLALRTLFDSVAGVDRVLNGPTNEKWIEPWIEYLEGHGVHFHWGWELRDVVFDEHGALLSSLQYGFVMADSLRRLRQLLAPLGRDLRRLIAYVPNADRGGSARSIVRRRFEENARQLGDLLDELNDAYRRDRRPRKEDPELLAALLKALDGCQDLLRVAREIIAIHAKMCDEDRALAPAERELKSPFVIADHLGAPAERSHLAHLVASLGLPPDNASLQERSEKSPVDWLQRIFAALKTARPETEESSLRLEDGALLNAARWRWIRYADVMFDEELLARIDDALRYVERNLERSNAPDKEADYFVLALPVEQMAYHVNRSVQAAFVDPELLKIVPLASHLDWMAGIQFYLKEPLNLGQGHVVAMDSEWALTAVEQTQFWDDLGSWPRDVKAVLSVDIAAWDRRGRFVNKEASNCLDDELAEEVWQELAVALSSDRGPQRLRKSMLLHDEKSALDGEQQFVKGVNFMIDDSIVDVCDRRKQGAYERARSARASATPEAPNPFGDAVRYIWGPRLRFNIEPLLVNRVGSHALRPDAKTRISNLFLASDYVRTETDLACMEGANEAARRAVNALLEVSGSRAKPCELWDFSIPSGLFDQVTNLARMGNAAQMAGDAGKVAGKAADAAVELAARAAGVLRGFWEKR